MFPTHLFPIPVPENTRVGVTRDLLAVPTGIPLTVALGDLQASLLPVLVDKEAGTAYPIRSPTDDRFEVLHLGTAPQMVFRVDSKPHAVLADNQALTCLPYFNGKRIVVAASLNGGNAFDIFIEVGSWLRLSGGFNNPTFSKFFALPRNSLEPLIFARAAKKLAIW